MLPGCDQREQSNLLALKSLKSDDFSKIRKISIKGKIFRVNRIQIILLWLQRAQRGESSGWYFITIRPRLSFLKPRWNV